MISFIIVFLDITIRCINGYCWTIPTSTIPALIQVGAIESVIELFGVAVYRAKKGGR